MYASGKVEEGIYKDNALVQGRVVMLDDEGDGELELEGRWQDGCIVEGVLRQAGICYEGEFKENLPHGQGQTVFPTGRKYIGLWAKCEWG